jgi:hypothetical protein
MFPGGLARRLLREHPDWPTSLPWGMVAQHRDRIEDDHGQRLEYIAGAGGLPPQSLLAALDGVKPCACREVTIPEAMSVLQARIKDWHRSHHRSAVAALRATRDPGA